jgi:Zn-dependent M28 family amino/carboxypeptidase
MLRVIFGVLSLFAAAWVWMTQPLLPGGAMKNQIGVDPQRLEVHVRMLSETFFPRDAGHPENLDRAAAYIQYELGKTSGTVSEQPYTVNGNTYRNVSAQFGLDTRERIIVGAHYDAAGPQPGADDNASGVAGLIELAHLLGRTSLPVRIELVAFTLEESPYFPTARMGSAVHAQSLKQQGIPVPVMLSLEMIGYFTDAPNSQTFPFSFFAAFYPTQGNFIAVVSKLDHGLVVRRVKRAMRNASPLPVYSINAPRFVPGVDFSDHRNYWEAGYNAVMITDTAFYRNKNYHTVGDTPDTLDYRRMAMVVQGVYAAVLAFAR